MKQITWYLPSGSGGMAALYKSKHIKNALTNWVSRYNIDIDLNKQLTFYSENGFRYYRLTLQDEQSVIFALTWNNDNPQTRYERIKEHTP